MKWINTVILGVTALAILASPAMSDNDRKLKKHPGYVDFSAAEMFEDEAKVEVYLREPLLKLASKFMKEEDPELYGILSKLMLVRVQVFDINRAQVTKAQEITDKTSKDLDSKGWERIVRVREEDEHVDVYLRPSDDFEKVLGIAVMVVSADDDEAVFVNIVGEINPEDIGRLGEHFDIHDLELEGLDKNELRRRHNG